jgi:hypothetical protein
MFHANRASILHQDQHYLQTDQTELSLEPLDLGVPSGVSKMHHFGVILGASKMVSYTLMHEAQTVHISCTETNTVSKHPKERFCMTHVIKEFYRVCPN